MYSIKIAKPLGNRISGAHFQHRWCENHNNKSYRFINERIGSGICHFPLCVCRKVNKFERFAFSKNQRKVKEKISGFVLFRWQIH